MDELLVHWTPDQVAWVQALAGVNGLVFLGKILYSLVTPLRSGVKMGTSKGTAGGSAAMV